jgi:deoxyribonuclease-4
MKRLGPHVSASGGVQNAPLNAHELGATAFGLFTKNQRQWRANPLSKADIDAFIKNCQTCGYSPNHILPHDSYLINLGNPDPAKRAISLESFVHEMERCDQLGLKFLNIHPGSHLREISEDECLKLIADQINRAFEKTRNVAVLLETTAGQGSNVGYRFEHLAAMIDRVDDTSRIGVCLDTCHIFAAGYDLRGAAAFAATFKAFDDTIGLGRLRAMHINDAKVELGSKVDRHQSIGKGTLGLAPFAAIMNDPRFEEMPLILETIDESLWADEIRLLYSFVKKPAP